MIEPSRHPTPTSKTIPETLAAPSLIEQKHDTLIKMIGEQHLFRVRPLPPKTFEPVLWEHLIAHNYDAYHIKMGEVLSHRTLWAQEDDTPHGISLHWSDGNNIIHSAHLCSRIDTIIAESRYLDSHTPQTCLDAPNRTIGPFPIGGRGRITYTGCSTEDFSAKITHISARKRPLRPRAHLHEKLAIKKQLELLPISIKVTKSACAQLLFLKQSYLNSATQVSIGIGTADAGNNFNPTAHKGEVLIDISHSLLLYRIPELFEKDEPEKISARVAPAFCSREALAQKKLFPPSKYHLNGERNVAWLEHIPTRIDLQQLRACMVITISPGIARTIKFKQKPPKTASEESLELSLDFKKNRWKTHCLFKERDPLCKACEGEL